MGCMKTSHCWKPRLVETYTRIQNTYYTWTGYMLEYLSIRCHRQIHIFIAMYKIVNVNCCRRIESYVPVWLPLAVYEK